MLSRHLFRRMSIRKKVIYGLRQPNSLKNVKDNKTKV